MAPAASAERAHLALAPGATRHAATAGAASVAPPKPSAKPAGMAALKIASPAPTQHASPAQIALSLRAKTTLSPAPTGRADAPRSAAAGRKPSLLWFRADLRLDDNEALVRATAESSSVLPVYCFDPRDFQAGPSGAPRVGAARAAFLLECVAELRAALRARGSDLLVRVGRPEAVLPALARAVGAAAVYTHAEVAAEELAVERDVARALDGLAARLHCLWGSTLHHLDDIPFRVDDMPANYAAFRAAVAGAPVRAAMPVPGTLRRTPLGSPEPGDMPTLKDLGVAAPPPAAHAAAADGMRGGEAEARRRLAAFAKQGTQAAGGAAPRAGGEGMYGPSFSCKISPWLAVGCLSPRRLYEELRAAHGAAAAPGALTTTAAGPSAATAPAGATNLNWLVFELIWRDFFRFITYKYGRTGGQKTAFPAAAEK